MTYTKCSHKWYREIPSQHLASSAITGRKESNYRVELFKPFRHLSCSLYKHWSGRTYLGVHLHIVGQSIRNQPQAWRNMETDEPEWSDPKYIPPEVHKWLWAHYKTLPKP